ncbi:hypothetical protein BC833DRAFT_568261 [Globomyces pollinis-pini]|nr:hypothetical protein BC833DRAFT_568261 [Globomyces pollinis-pini]
MKDTVQLDYPSPRTSCYTSPNLKSSRVSKRKAIPFRSVKTLANKDDKFVEGIVNLDVYSIYMKNPQNLLPSSTKVKCFSSITPVTLVGFESTNTSTFNADEYKNTKGAPDVVWKKGSMLKISPDVEDYNKLTFEEIRIASTLRLLPSQYLDIKSTILTQVKKRGPFKKRDAKSWFKIDVNKTAILYDWFKGLGWIPSDEDWEKSKN